MGFPSFSGVLSGILVFVNTFLSVQSLKILPVQSLKDIAESFMYILSLFFSTSSANNIQVNNRSTQLLRREYSNSNPETSSETAPVLGSELAQLPLIADEIRLRRREQELTEELMFWFSSFHCHGFHSMWWLRANLERCSEDFGSTSEKPRDAWQQSLGRGDRVSPKYQRGNDNRVSMRPDRTMGRDAHFGLYN
ncbi:hypothetical protein KI387_014906 [Taxus chinensis]|uniref:Uncharacterized protein n=1 Tax=Taxus chinensis TaxID=29808 RepID=A0AA38FHL6_TAXCH|nr:hypothetical protein KI387_014906 [Taxus chinensis]